MPVIVYENEPSSIVAFALNSADYKKEFPVKKLQTSESSPIQKRKYQLERPESIDGSAASNLEKSVKLLSFLRSKEGKLDSCSGSQVVATDQS